MEPTDLELVLVADRTDLVLDMDQDLDLVMVLTVPVPETEPMALDLITRVPDMEHIARTEEVEEELDMDLMDRRRMERRMDMEDPMEEMEVKGPPAMDPVMEATVLHLAPVMVPMALVMDPMALETDPMALVLVPMALVMDPDMSMEGMEGMEDTAIMALIHLTDRTVDMEMTDLALGTALVTVLDTALAPMVSLAMEEAAVTALALDTTLVVERMATMDMAHPLNPVEPPLPPLLHLLPLPQRRIHRIERVLVRDRQSRTPLPLMDTTLPSLPLPLTLSPLSIPLFLNPIPMEATTRDSTLLLLPLLSRPLLLLLATMVPLPPINQPLIAFLLLYTLRLLPVPQPLQLRVMVDTTTVSRVDRE